MLPCAWSVQCIAVLHKQVHHACVLSSRLTLHTCSIKLAATLVHLLVAVGWADFLTCVFLFMVQDRDHLKFVCKLKDYVPDQHKLLDGFPAALEEAGMSVQEADIQEAEQALQRDYFKNTKLVDLASGKQLTADVHPSSGHIAPGKQRALYLLGSQ